VKLRLLLLPLVAGIAVAQPMIVKTTTLIDGKGHVLRNQQIAIENGRITHIGAANDKPTIDLSGLTVMPGWIDTHVHPTWYFNKQGRLEEEGPGIKSTPQQAACMRRPICTRHSWADSPPSKAWAQRSMVIFAK
jgi:imidazolonepropionase-like amidohydrolase